MNRSPAPGAPVDYRLRVEGHLAPRWSHRFGDLTLTLEDDGTTSISGAIADQAELHGVLNKIRDLGIALISVQLVEPADATSHQQPSPASSSHR